MSRAKSSQIAHIERSGNLHREENYSCGFFSAGGVFPDSRPPVPVAPGRAAPDQEPQEYERQDQWYLEDGQRE